MHLHQHYAAAVLVERSAALAARHCTENDRGREPRVTMARLRVRWPRRVAVELRTGA